MTKITIINEAALRKELADIKKELTQFPEGQLYIKNKFYYHRHEGKEKGITRNPDLIRQLARYKYLQIREKQLENNLSQPINKFDHRTPRQLIATLSKAYQTVPESYFYHPSVEQWLANPPRINTLNPENAKYLYQDIAYRSLSEREIAKKLDENGLLFYCDSRFNVGIAEISPDFYIKNPFNGKIFLWEFFGAFHIPNYGDRMNNKMATYAKMGFTENDNLIATFEHHLRDTNRIQEMIDRIIW